MSEAQHPVQNPLGAATEKRHTLKQSQPDWADLQQELVSFTQRKIKVCAPTPLDRLKAAPFQCVTTQEDWNLAVTSHRKWIWLTAIDLGAMAGQVYMDLSKAANNRAEAERFFCCEPVMLERKVGKQIVEAIITPLQYAEGQATILLQTVIMSVGEQSSWWLPVGCVQTFVAENMQSYSKAMALKALKARNLFLAWDTDGSGELEFNELRAVRDWFTDNVPHGIIGFNVNSLWEQLPQDRGINQEDFEKWLTSQTSQLPQEVFDELEMRIQQFIATRVLGTAVKQNEQGRRGAIKTVYTGDLAGEVPGTDA